MIEDRIRRDLTEADLSMFLVADASGVETVTPDWLDDSSELHQAITMTLGGDLYAYVAEGSPIVPGPTRIWRSVDGRSWGDLGIAAWGSSPMAVQSLVESNGVQVVALWDGDQRFEIMWSTDGVAWFDAAEPPELTGESPRAGVFVLEKGFVLSPHPISTDYTIWVSPDGDTWQQVDTGSIAGGGRALAVGPSSTGALVDFGVRGGTTTVWLIEYLG